jgi:threonine dehydrogenase-like Zn-dependent dehydrogenase
MRELTILAGHGPISPPFAIGHECVARVVEVGDAVSTVTRGDVVVVPWAISCGDCDPAVESTGRGDQLANPLTSDTQATP